LRDLTRRFDGHEVLCKVRMAEDQRRAPKLSVCLSWKIIFLPGDFVIAGRPGVEIDRSWRRQGTPISAS
jgi:hypothetical protein